MNIKYRTYFLEAALAAGFSWICVAVPVSVLAGVRNPDPLAYDAAKASTQFVGWASGANANGYATILYTTNGGSTWMRQGNTTDIADVTLTCVAAVDADTAWAVGSATQGYATIYHTTNAGTTWVRQGDPDTVANVELAKISACSRDVVWVAGDKATVLRTIDGGRTWQNRSPPGYTNFFQGITALDANIAWAGGHNQGGYATILHTTNGGLSWVRQSSGVTTNIDNILSIGAWDSKRLWAVGFRGISDGRIICTTNGGATWTVQYSAAYHGNELYVVSTAQVYVAFDTFVIKTINGGQSWEPVGIRSTAYATMGICAPDGRNIWAASENWAGGFIYNLPAGGPDWIDQTPTNGIAMLSYISMVRHPYPASMGTLAITVTPSNGVWTLHGPPVGYTGPVCGTGSLAAQVPGGHYNVSFSALPGFRTPSNQTFEVTAGQASVITGLYLSRQVNDYDGDGKTDLAVFEPATGNWYVFYSSTLSQGTMKFGNSGSAPVVGDFDGDGKSDVAVFETDIGYWYIFYSSTLSLGTTQYGNSDCTPVSGDYDGDYKTDLVVFEGATGSWSILYSSTYSMALMSFGNSGCTPVARGDYDGDGKTDVTVFEAATGYWYIFYSSTLTMGTVQFGNSNCTPLAGDYDGDGKTDLVVFERTTGIWYILYSSTLTMATMQFGNSGCTPVAGDYDGDGKTDVTVYENSTGYWYIFYSSTLTMGSILFGNSNCVPVTP